MFVSAAELPKEQPLDADLVIVGAGPAGLLLACELMSRGLRIVILESGGQEFSREVQLLNRGDVTGAPNYLPVHARYRTYGGSVTRWAGQCVPFEPIDFEEREGISHTGWPFDRAHLDPWYALAAERLGCDPLGFDPVAWEQCAGPLPPIDRSEITARVIGFASPLDVGAARRAALSRAPDVTVVEGATVTAVETDDTMSHATGLRFATLDGREGRCAGRRIVLAAGGIENPRLMLASTDRSEAGIGNARGLVGRYFIDHPYLMPGWFEPADPAHDKGWHVIETFEGAAADPGAHAAFTLTEDLRRREGLPGCVGYFVRREAWQLRRSYVAPGGAALAHLAEVARGTVVRDGDIGRHALNLVRDAPSTLAALAGWAASAVAPKPRAGLRICLESTPHPDSRVTLGDRRDALGQRLPRIHWQINERDWAALRRFRETLARAIAGPGLGRLVYDEATDGEGYPLSMTGGRHHMGTTRMSRDPGKGVVDETLRVHGMENLYVLGSSVFPTGSWANPTLTISALSLRLAHHLAQPK